MKYKITFKIRGEEVTLYANDYQSCLSIVDIYGYYMAVEHEPVRMYKIEVIENE